MDYVNKFKHLKSLLVDHDGNKNLVRDFFIQLSFARKLNEEMITTALEGSDVPVPEWLELVTHCDIHNIVVYLMWKEFQTVISLPDSTESLLGTRIEELSTYLESVYYVDQIRNIYECNEESYIDWVKTLIDTRGLKYTIQQLMP